MNGCRPLSTEEYDRVYTYLSVHNRHRDLVLVSMCMWTGYRINEVLSMRMKDVMNGAGEVREKIQVPPRFMKRKRPRPAIFVNEKLRSDLNRYITYLESAGQLSKGDPLIPSKKGGAISYTQAYRIIKDVFDATDIYENVACHSFRKTFAEDFYNRSGRDIVATMRVMGHSDTQTTLSYLSTGQAEIDAVVAQM